MRRTQMRAARALLGWQQEDLARQSGVSLPTIKRIEAGEGTVNANSDTVSKIDAAFKQSGLELLEDGQKSEGDGFGVRYMKPAPDTIADILYLLLKKSTQTRMVLLEMLGATLREEPEQSSKRGRAEAMMKLLNKQDGLEVELLNMLKTEEPGKADDFQRMIDYINRSRAT